MARFEFDMIVLGGGAAGLTAAGFSSLLGAKTALVESGRLGGDCTWTGCVPSKTLLKAAKVAHQMRTADRYGLKAQTPEIDFAALMDHVRSVQQGIYEDADAPPNMEKLGVTVVGGRARFQDPHTIQVTSATGQRTMTASKFVIATGSAPTIPKIAGLEQFHTVTNETIFSLSSLPKRLVIVGGGPIGVEMAQAFQRLGSQVTVIAKERRILPHDDEELSLMLQQVLVGEGIEFRFGTEFHSQMGKDLGADVLLIAAGRTASTKDLNLDAAGVKCGAHGIEVNAHCCTSARHIYACGDVIGKFQFTHMAEHGAKVAINNAILHWPQRFEEQFVPWVTFTDPELAHFGVSQGATLRLPFAKIDRALTDNEPAGMIKGYATERGRITGATILGANAGEMIGEWAVAARSGLKWSDIANTIHPYPTLILGNRKVADQSLLAARTPGRIRWLQRIFGYRGSFVHYE